MSKSDIIHFVNLEKRENERFFLWQDTAMTSYNEGPDIDEESVQVQDQDNEAEIMDGK